MKITALIVAVMMLISSVMFVMNASAQPTGVQNVIIRPDGDNLAQWTTVVGAEIISKSVILRPSGDFVANFETIYPAYSTGYTIVYPEADAYVYSGAPSTNYGSNTQNYVGYYKSREIYQRYDIAGSIPSGAVMTSAVSWNLYKYYDNRDATGQKKMYLNATAFGDWGESTITWNNKPAHYSSLAIFDTDISTNVWRTLSNASLVANITDQYQKTGKFHCVISAVDVAQYGSSGYMMEEYTGTTYDPYINVSWSIGTPYHYDKINEAVAGGDGSSTYVSHGSTVSYDRFVFQNLTDSNIVPGSIDVTLWCILTSDGGVNRYGLTNGVTSYYYDPVLGNSSNKWSINPFTSAEWTVSDLTSWSLPYVSTQTGPGTANYMAVTQMGVIVDYQIYYGHWSAVDDALAGGDGDASYIASSTIGHIDRLTLSNVPLGCSGEIKSIISVDFWAIGRNGGGGNNDVRAGFYIGTTYYLQLQTPVGTTYTNFSTGALTTNPATSSAWTISDIQNLIVYIYANQNKEMRYTQLGVIVSVNYGWASTFTSTPPTAPHAGYWWPGDAYSYTVTLNESASLSNDAKPSWLTWTSGNSTLWGRLAINIQTQSASVVFHATSTNGKQCSWQNFTIEVKNDAPYYTSSPDTDCSWNLDYSHDVDATDPEGQTLTYGLQTNWTGLTIDPASGLLTKSKPHVNGTYYVNVNVSDGLNLVWQNWTLEVGNEKPSFTSTPVYSVTETFPYEYIATATDPEGSGITFDCTEKPAFLTFTPANQTLWGRPAVDAWLGGHSVKLRAYDGDKYGYQNFTLTVNPVWSATFTSSPVITGETGDAYYYDVNTNETCAFSIAQQAVGGTLNINSVTGIITGTFSNSYAGTKWVNVSAVNARGKTANQNYTITITDDEAPIANAGPDRNAVPIQQLMQFNGSASTDNIGVVNWTWTFDDNGVKTVYGEFGSYIWVTLGSHIVTLTVMDAQGLSDTDTLFVNTTRSFILRPISTLVIDYPFGTNPSAAYWENLDDPETGGDGDSTYIYNAGGTYSDATLEMGNFSSLAGENYWIQLWMVAKAQTGTPQARAYLKNGSTDLGIIIASLDTIYRNYTLNLTKYQSREWTAADLDNLVVRLTTPDPTVAYITQIGIMVWFEVDFSPPIANIQHSIKGGSWVESPSAFEVSWVVDYEYVPMSFRTTGGYEPSYINWVNYTWKIYYKTNTSLIATYYGSMMNFTFRETTTYIISLNMTVSKAWGVLESDSKSINPLTVKGRPFDAGTYIISNIMGFVGVAAFFGMILVLPMAVIWHRKGGEGIGTARNAIIIFFVCLGLFMASLVF